MVYAVVSGILASLIVFFAVRAVGTGLVNSIYMSAESVTQRKNAVYREFITYINQNQLASTDTEAISAWSREHDYSTILLFKDKMLDMRIHGGVADQDPKEKKTLAEARELYGSIYTVRFTDGFVQIAISETSQTRQLALVTVEAVSIGCLVFLIIMLTFTANLTQRIIRLSQETRQISSGDLDGPITTSGGDEVSLLARDVDAMRNSVIERMSNEQKAWQANSDLITAMSHDIRTPMTALIGYLEIIRSTDPTDGEKLDKFSAAAYDKSMELKELTDELFKYFLAFGSEMNMDMEAVDASLLIGQLLGEAQFELEDNGFTVQSIPCDRNCIVNAAPLYLKRVVDNMVSNVKKYAAPEKNVVFSWTVRDNLLSVRITNTVKKLKNKVESTKIGIRTCEKIMSRMGGGFTGRSDGMHFTAEFTLPVKLPIPAEEESE